MSRLIWKELYEKRIWWLLLLISTAGTIFLGTGYMFIGDDMSPWISISFVIALLMGASSHASELNDNTTDFLFSRPIRWWKVLLAKLIVGISLLIITILATAVIFRFFCPAPYVRLLTPTVFLIGIGRSVLYIGSVYLLGFFTSAVLPGTLGSLLVFIVAVLFLGIESMIQNYYHAQPLNNWRIYMWALGGVVATISTVRFGLTLPLKRRLSRWATVFTCITLVGVPLAYVRNIDPFSIKRTMNYFDIGPNARYMISQRILFSEVNQRYENNFSIIKMPDKSSGKVPSLDMRIGEQGIWWLKNDTFAALNPNKLYIGKIGKSGNADIKSLTITGNPQRSASMIPSPDCRYLLLSIPDNNDTRLVVVDMNEQRLQELTAPSTIIWAWWQSNEQIGYLDASSIRRFFTITN